ncbi:MAG: sodium-dependent transporter [Clostridia bacterium]|nr:sodium-dependent transporter [Clostridia bacterium]
MSKQRWGSRFTFILAAIGSAVGLGNCWRFPGLCAKHGGGAFLLIYIVALIVLGIPLLSMEIAIGRRMRGGAPKALKGIHKQGEKIGWSAVFNSFVICTYYAIVFAWVIAMVFASISFGPMTDSPTGIQDASNLFADVVIQTTWDVSFLGAGGNIPIWMLLAGVAAWGLIYYCIRNGAASVSKVVKYTVFIPVILLVVLALKGFIANPYLGEAMYTLFIPDWSAFADPTIWIDAFGQVFYSLSIMMAIMFAYGSYLNNDSNVATDTLIIAMSDMLISVLSAIVLFSTMYSSGMTVADMSTSGIGTAFIIYPMAIVQFTPIGWINSIFGVIFYLTLATLAIDSAFSIAEGVSKAFSDKLGVDQKKVTKRVVLIMACISVIFLTGAGLGWLDIVDNWTNMFNLIIIGVAECILVGWFFKPSKVWEDINRNTKKYRMPKWWFIASVKFIAPVILAFFCGWNLVNLFMKGGYGYPLWAEILGGWLITAISISAGFIMQFITTKNKKIRKMVELTERYEKTWDEMDYNLIEDDKALNDENVNESVTEQTANEEA